MFLDARLLNTQFMFDDTNFYINDINNNTSFLYTQFFFFCNPLKNSGKL